MSNQSRVSKRMDKLLNSREAKSFFTLSNAMGLESFVMVGSGTHHQHQTTMSIDAVKSWVSSIPDTDGDASYPFKLPPMPCSMDILYKNQSKLRTYSGLVKKVFLPDNKGSLGTGSFPLWKFKCPVSMFGPTCKNLLSKWAFTGDTLAMESLYSWESLKEADSWSHGPPKKDRQVPWTNCQAFFVQIAHIATNTELWDEGVPQTPDFAKFGRPSRSSSSDFGDFREFLRGDDSDDFVDTTPVVVLKNRPKRPRMAAAAAARPPPPSTAISTGRAPAPCPPAGPTTPHCPPGPPGPPVHEPTRQPSVATDSELGFFHDNDDDVFSRMVGAPSYVTPSIHQQPSHSSSINCPPPVMASFQDDPSLTFSSPRVIKRQHTRHSSTFTSPSAPSSSSTKRHFSEPYRSPAQPPAFTRRGSDAEGLPIPGSFQDDGTPLLLAPVFTQTGYIPPHDAVLLQFLGKEGVEKDGSPIVWLSDGVHYVRATVNESFAYYFSGTAYSVQPFDILEIRGFCGSFVTDTFQVTKFIRSRTITNPKMTIGNPKLFEPLMITTRPANPPSFSDTLGLDLPDPHDLQEEDTTAATNENDSDFTINTDDCSLFSDSSFY